MSTSTYPGTQETLDIYLMADSGWPAIRSKAALWVKIDGPERLAVMTTRTGANRYSSTFRLYTPGMYNVSVVFELLGVDHDTPVQELDYRFGKADFHSSWKWRVIKTVELEVIDNTRQMKAVEGMFQTLPVCDRNNARLGMNGRWIQTDRVAPWMFKGTLPVSNMKTYPEVFVPDDCMIRYFTPREAGRCLSGKQILFLGDSTIEELAIEMGLFAGRVTEGKVVNLKPWLGSDASKCDLPNQRLRFFSLPFRGDTQISFCWAGERLPCLASDEGLNSWAFPKFRDMIKTCAYHPDIIPQFDVHRIEENATVSYERPRTRGRKTHAIVFGSVLHDLEAITNQQNTFANYVRQWGPVMDFLKSCSVNRTILHDR
ncbi:hypothetical protein HK104_003561 [Borealophlyctis nickersoniae]|nr:hypothetical protein HK104_003561 [Borealophlyctis nickersoniae]